MVAWLNALEHNVKYVFLFTISYWSANSIISQQVLSGYIFVLTGSNEPVGIVKGIQGVSQLICAFPAGYAADHLRRDRILTVAGVLGLFTSILTAFAFQIGHLQLIYVAFGLWGVFSAFQNPTMEALFADSVPNGQRSFPFMLKHIVLNTALVIGPLCAIALFLHYGDVWELHVLRPVVLFGTFVAAASMSVLFMFNDDKAYENQQRQLEVDRHLRSLERNFDAELSYFMDERSRVSVQGDDRVKESSSLLQSPRANVIPNALYTTVLEHDTVDIEGSSSKKEPSCCGLDVSHVPYVLFVSDFIISNGAGMTVNFFSLFFYTEYGFTPTHVQWLFVGEPLCVAIASFFSQWISRYCGRMPVIVLTRVIGTSCLLLMSIVTSLHWQCALFLIRTSMMRCTEPLRRSLLMDFVPKHQRARWNSLEGITMFSWAGSAVIGGFLVEAHGYRYCFFITAMVYFVGVLLEIVLIPVTRYAVETTKSKVSSSAIH